MHSDDIKPGVGLLEVILFDDASVLALHDELLVFYRDAGTGRD